MPTQGVCTAMVSCAADDDRFHGRRRRLAEEDRLLSEITEAGERGSRRRRCGARDLALAGGEMELRGFDSAKGAAVACRVTAKGSMAKGGSPWKLGQGLVVGCRARRKGCG